MIRGEGITIARGVTPDEAFDFVLDPAQYTKADTKMVWATKLADTPDGMVAREVCRFLGRFRGSVITRYSLGEAAPHIDVTLEHGVPKNLHAWFEIEAARGARRHHVEELDLGQGTVGWLHDAVARTGSPGRSRRRWPRSPASWESGERGRGEA